MRVLHGTFACLIVGIGAGLLTSCGGGSYGGGSNPPASLTISVSPDTITLGESATVTWTSNAPCTASGAWSGTKARSGSETVTPAETGTFTYTLVCRGDGYGSSETESDTLTVTPAALASLMNGNACCDPIESFAVTGITTSAGEDRILLLDTHYVGTVGGKQVAYEVCNSCLAGRLKTDPNQFKLLAIAPGDSVRASIKAPDQASRPQALEFTVPYDRLSQRTPSNTVVQGIYTTNLGTGYTLTVTVDAAGQVIGNDTNGCRLDGQILPDRNLANHYNVALNVTACGRSDGRYGGCAALIFDDSGDARELFLSASSSDSAIGWRLSR